MRERNFFGRPAAMDVAMLALGLSTLLSACLSRYQGDVWLGANARYQGALIVALYVLVYFGLSEGLGRAGANRSVRYLLIGFSAVSVMAILHAFGVDPFGWFVHVGAEQRTQFISTIGNVNFFSAYGCLCVPCIVVLAAHARKTAARILSAVLLVLGGIAVVLSGSESMMIGVVAFFAVAPFFFFGNRRKLIGFCFSSLVVFLSAAIFLWIYRLPATPIYQPAALVSLVVGGPLLLFPLSLLIALALLAYFVPRSLRWIRIGYGALLALMAVAAGGLLVYSNFFNPEFLGGIFTFGDAWGSGRGSIFRLCFAAMEEFSLKDWLLGIGPESLQNVMRAQGITYIDQAHCEYLQTLLSTGLIGLAAQLGLIAATAVSVVRRLRKEPVAIALFLSLVAYWAQAVVNIAQPFTTPLMFAFLAILKSMQNIDDREKESKS